jgi:hypothetical protein
LKYVLLRMGFHRQWVQWIMTCVTTVRYSVRFNNVVLESFKPLGGLRQSDTLSPFMFLFVADGLTKLLQKEVAKHNLQELHICRRGPGISHLLFADNTLLFFQASEEQATVIKRVINEYEKGTGQQINPSKCSMLFGSMCTQQNKNKVLELLEVDNAVGESKYLGLPTTEGRMNKERIKMTKEKLVKRCSGWAKKHMSSAAKEVLVKSVAQAIPTYIMGVFKLSLNLCEELNQVIRKFWWREEDGKRKVHWIA